MPHLPATIFALSSGRPPAAIAVVRISGPRAGMALEALTGRIPEPRRAALVRVRDPASGEPIDQALALWFPGPRSETGEDMAELQLHGGRAVIAAVFAALGRLEGLRPAEAGEFTRRAFANGKLDLTRVEGLADLIYADSEAQRRQALRQLQGMLGDRAEAWRRKLIEALALVEARIDFADEADVPEALVEPALAIAGELAREIAATLADQRRGEKLREGLVVAIAGPPNAGKSSLLNRIVRREAAIVSPYAGTTRDVIEVHLDLAGYPVTFLDTAGIRASDDPVEQEGVRRARERAAAADLVLWVVDAREGGLDGDSLEGFRSSGDGPIVATREPRAPPLPSGERGASGASRVRGDNTLDRPVPPHPNPLPKGERERAQCVAGFEASPVTPATSTRSPGLRWVVWNKIDLVCGPINELNYIIHNIEYRSFLISATTGAGLDSLLGSIQAHAAQVLGESEPALVTRERHRRALEETRAALGRALSEPAKDREEIVAEELRLAARALGRLVGRVDVEDVLDVIFRDFCIGK